MPIASGAWSGAVVLSPPGDSVTSVEGTWKIPSTPATPNNQNGNVWSPVSCWIGIDGYGQSIDVLQAGCDVDVLSPGILEVILWYEWYPQDYVRIDEITASVGDEINVIITVNQRTNVSTIEFRNLTTNQISPPYSVDPPPGTIFIGNCAEWIVEALQNINHVPQLAAFSAVEFTNCKAGTSAGSILQPVNGDSMYIVNSADPPATIARGEIVNATTVKISYV